MESIAEFNLIYVCKSHEINNNQLYILVYRQDAQRYKNAPKFLVIEPQRIRTIGRSRGRLSLLTDRSWSLWSRVPKNKEMTQKLQFNLFHIPFSIFLSDPFLLLFIFPLSPIVLPLIPLLLLLILLLLLLKLLPLILIFHKHLSLIFFSNFLMHIFILSGSPYNRNAMTEVREMQGKMADELK